MKTFTQMKTNVGNMVMDTSSAFATLIGRWINDKYQDVWNRYNWSDVINNNYSRTTIAADTSGTSCSANATTNAFTASSHGLLTGDMVTFGGTTLPTGITAGKYYYLINVTTDTFQVSTADGGSAVDITSTGTSVTFTLKARSYYDLPLDFDQEINVVNITDGDKLDRYNERLWWEERYSAWDNNNVIYPGAFPKRYVILRERVNSTQSGYGVIFFDPPVDAAKTIVIPYKRKFEDLISVTGTATTDTTGKVIASASTFITSGVKPGMRIKNTTDTLYSIITSVDSETQVTTETDVCPDGNESFEIFTSPVIRDIEVVLEAGATAEAYLYKKNFSKAGDFLQKYEFELNKRITQENTQPNQLYQRIPANPGSSAVKPFTGWSSYDTV